MKTYKQYVNEEVMPFAQTDKNFIGVESEAVRDNINDLLDGVTNKGFVTPYNALERVAKVLAYSHIHLPKYTFSEGDHGATAFQVNQFGLKAGMTNNGEFVKNVPAQYYVYFEYHKGDTGLYDVFACVCDKGELDDLISDYQSDTDNNFDRRFVDELTPSDHKYERNMQDVSGTQLYEAPKMVTDPANPSRQVIPEFAMGAAKKASKIAKNKKKDLNENYHETYSGAIKAAVDAAKKRGYEVDADDYDSKVASGPRKPSEGKTVSHNLKLTKDGKPTKKGLAIQVYNKGGKTPYELNHYISESKDDSTMPAWYQKEKAKSLTLQAMTAAKKKQQGKKIKQAIRLTKEEALDEVLDDTMKQISYLDKARTSMHQGMKDADYAKGEKAKKGFRTAEKRHNGIQMLSRKLAKEETLDEVSKELATRASVKAGHKADMAYNTMQNSTGKRSNDAMDRHNKRTDQSARFAAYAAKKQINELSNKTKIAYVNAATKDKAELNKQITKDTFSKSPYHDSESSRLKDIALGHKLVANRTKGIARATKGLKEASNPAREGEIAAGRKGSNPAEQGSIAVKNDDRKSNFKVAKKLARQAAKAIANKKKD